MKLTWRQILGISAGFAAVISLLPWALIGGWPPPLRWMIGLSLPAFVVGFLWAFRRRDPETRIRWYAVTLAGTAALMCIFRGGIAGSGKVSFESTFLNVAIGIGSPDSLNALQLILGTTLIVALLWFVNRPPMTGEEASVEEALLEEEVDQSPPPERPEPEVFWRRIQVLFEHRAHAKIGLEYDGESKCLVGSVTSGLDDQIDLIVRCDDGDQPITAVAASDLMNRGGQQARRYYAVNDQARVSERLIDDFRDIRFVDEGQLVDEMVDFGPYLQRVVNSYSKDALPFTTRQNAPTLQDTFVEPPFELQDGSKHVQTKPSESLAEYFDRWLDEVSWRQLVLLADYGMGKSSFLLFYAYRLARRRLDEGRGRIPVLVELTGRSPRNDPRCEDLLSRFQDRFDLGCTSESLGVLMRRGQLVFLLDAFDEVDLVGDSGLRREHFEALWTLAEWGNKVLIAGRPGYFPSGTERRRALKLDGGSMVALSDRPYSVSVRLLPFTEAQIRASFAAYFPEAEAEQHFDYVMGRPELKDLATRPALVHMLRETIGAIHEKAASAEEISATRLIELYADRWISREARKNRRLLVEREQRDRFMQSVALHMFAGGRPQVSVSELQRLAEPLLIEGTDNDEAQVREGILTDLRTCSFVVPVVGRHDSFRFAHKAFYEYFAAKGLTWCVRRGSKVPRHDEWWGHEICGHYAALAVPRALVTSLASYQAVLKSQAWPLLRIGVRNRIQVALYAGLPVKGQMRASVKYMRRSRRGEHEHTFSIFPHDAFRRGDLTKLDLRNADLRGLNLSLAKFNDAILDGADLTGADLRLAHLLETSAVETNFGGTRLICASFAGANVEGASFEKADLRGAEFTAPRWADLPESERLAVWRSYVKQRLKRVKPHELAGLGAHGVGLTMFIPNSWISRILRLLRVVAPWLANRDLVVVAMSRALKFVTFVHSPANVSGSNISDARMAGVADQHIDWSEAIGTPASLSTARADVGVRGDPPG